MGAAGTFFRDLRTVLRGRDFRWLFAVRLTSQASDGVFQVALASLLFFSPQRAATAHGVAAAFAVVILPYTVIGPFAGVLLDCWSRRNVLISANLVRVGLVLAIAALVSRGTAGPALYLLVLACISVNRFFLAGLGASLPHVVPRHELVMANAVSPTSGTIAVILGGGAGYGLRAALGIGSGTDAVVLLAAVAGYGASIALATRLHASALGPDDAERRPWRQLGPAAAQVGADVARGLQHVRERRPALHALLAIGAHRFAYGATTLATILLCRNHFTDPDDVDAGLALLAAAFAVSGAGFAVAAVVTPVATQRFSPAAWVVACYAGAAVAGATLALRLTVPLALTVAFILGLAAQSSKICVDAIVQREAADAFRGRVMSFYDVVFNAAFLAAAAASAVLLPPDGHSPPAFLGIAAIYGLTAVGYRTAQIRTANRRLD